MPNQMIFALIIEAGLVSLSILLLAHNYTITSLISNLSELFPQLRTLQLRFEKYLQRTIAAEIRRVRIERAKRELARGCRTTKEIAHEAGFGDVKRMYETFRRELGTTPGQYRKERQKGQE